MKLYFWNVHGFINLKDSINDFNDNDMLCLTETWLCDDGMVVENLNEFDVFHSFAVKSKLYGRGSGGLAFLFNKKYYECANIYSDTNFLIIDVQGALLSTIVIITYISPLDNFDNFCVRLVNNISWVENTFAKPIIISGDFNARIGLLNQFTGDFFMPSSLSERRNSIDIEVNRRGDKLMKIMEEEGFIVINGRSKLDSKGICTFMGPNGSSSLLDLVWSNFSGIDLIHELEVRLDIHTSDHFPVCLFMDVPVECELKTRNVETENDRLVWKKSGCAQYYNFMQMCSNVVNIWGGVDEMNEVLVHSIKNVAKTVGLVPKNGYHKLYKKSGTTLNVLLVREISIRL